MSYQSIEPGLRRTTWVLVTALLLVFGLGLSHHFHLVVCTGDCCAHAATHASPSPRTTHCTCCCHEQARAEPGPGDREAEPSGRHRSACKPGCCVDLVFDVELAPAPRGTIDHVPGPCAIASVEVPGSVSARYWPQWAWPHDTGPPRPDRLTALRASTVLRL